MVICWNSTLVGRGRDITGGCNVHLRLPSRRGSRKNTDRFPRRGPKAQASSGGSGACSTLKFFGFQSHPASWSLAISILHGLSLANRRIISSLDFKLQSFSLLFKMYLLQYYKSVRFSENVGNRCGSPPA